MRILTFILVICSSITFGQNSTKPKVKLNYAKERRIVKHNRIEKINKLLGKGLDTTQIIDLLYCSCMYGKYNIAKLMIDNGANINKQYSNKMTPLLESTLGSKGNDSISELLIRKGANVNSIGAYGGTALRHTIGVAGHRRKVELFKLLIEYGADINYYCNECCNRTPFLYCCGWGTTEMINILLDKKVGINQTDCEGLNGLMYAIKAENTEGVKLLLSTSIDLKHKDKSSLNALDYAMDSKNEGIIKLIKDKIKE